jgi:outer membrane autotransporter protein
MATILLGAPPVLAQRSLTRVADTPNQRSTGNAVDTVCPQLANAGGGSRTLPAVQQDLFERCRELVQSANQVLGQGDTEFSLGLSQQGVQDALEAVSHEQVTTQGDGAVATASGQIINLRSRLSALRSGVRGFRVTGIPVDGSSSPALAQATPSQTTDASSGVGAANRFGAFITGTLSFGDKDETRFEEGFDFDGVGITVGGDYRFTDQLILGLAFGYSTVEATFDASAGEASTDSFSLSVYGTYYLDALYLDFIGTFGWNDYSTVRNIRYTGVDRTALGDTDGFQYAFAVGAGYDFSFGPATLGPYGRLSYLNLQIDGYRERGAEGLNLEIGEQELDSLVLALGAQVSYAFRTGFGALIPAARFEWRHEFLNDRRSVTAKYANDPFNTFFAISSDEPDRDYFALGVGLVAVLSRRVTAFVDYETVLALADVTNHIVTLGLRVEF